MKVLSSRSFALVTMATLATACAPRRAADAASSPTDGAAPQLEAARSSVPAVAPAETASPPSESPVPAAETPAAPSRVALDDYQIPLSIDMPADSKKEKLDFPDAKGVWIKGNGLMVRVYPADKHRSTIPGAKHYLTSVARGRVKASAFVTEEPDLLVWDDGIGQFDLLSVTKIEDKAWVCQGTAKPDQRDAYVAACRSLKSAK